MIIVKVKSSFKGELVLASIGYPIKAGYEVSLDRVSYYSSDIQVALRMGLLELKDKSLASAWSPSKNYKVKNITGKALTIGEDLSFLKDEVKYIGEDKFLTGVVQTSINRGWLYSEEAVEVEKVEKVKKKPIKKHVKKEVYRPKDVKTKMSSWNAEKQKSISKKDSKNKVIAKTSGHIPKSESEEIQVGEIDFLDIYEPSEILSKKRGRPSSASKSARTIKTGKSIRPVGEVRESITPNLGPTINIPRPSSDDVTFVDSEQHLKKLAVHPDKRIARNNSEV